MRKRMKAIDMQHHFAAPEVIYFLSRDAISPVRSFEAEKRSIASPKRAK
jgi:hypothetical protein